MTTPNIEPHCYCYCYEWHTPVGITRSLRSAPRNGANCDTVVALYTADQLAAAVADAVAAERERCAQVCLEMASIWLGDPVLAGMADGAEDCADAIRAGDGEQK